MKNESNSWLGSDVGLWMHWLSVNNQSRPGLDCFSFSKASLSSFTTFTYSSSVMHFSRGIKVIMIRAGPTLSVKGPLCSCQPHVFCPSFCDWQQEEKTINSCGSCPFAPQPTTFCPVAKQCEKDFHSQNYTCLCRLCTRAVETKTSLSFYNHSIRRSNFEPVDLKMDSSRPTCS